jgi:ABC transporter substrate binding protein
MDPKLLYEVYGKLTPARLGGSPMRRRDFIRGAAAWPLAAHAQPPEQMRHIGVLMTVASDGPEGHARLAAFLEGPQQLGWADGRNVRIDYHWGAGDAERSRKYAAQLVKLSPDVILASGDPVMALQRATRTVPIVFTIIADPVGAGLVEGLAPRRQQHRPHVVSKGCKQEAAPMNAHSGQFNTVGFDSRRPADRRLCNAKGLRGRRNVIRN